MKDWWEHHYYIFQNMNDSQKEEIEDITGKIPLFLNILLKYMKSGSKSFEEASKHLNQELLLKVQEPIITFSESVWSDRYAFFVILYWQTVLKLISISIGM